MSTALRIVVAGAGGRMGHAVISALRNRNDAVLHAALEAPGNASLGKDAGMMAGGAPLNVPVTQDALAAVVRADAIIDFTTPASSVALAALAAQARIVHVIGSTGFAAADEEKIKAAARHAVIVKSGNFSLGVNALMMLVREAARMLPAYDAEIVETHHAQKADAPSGTALMIARAIAEGRKLTPEDVIAPPHHGLTGPRQKGRIAIASVRAGSVVGDHTAIFAGARERIEITHRAEDRAIFAEGALAAALWGHGKKPGLYSMEDVLRG